MFLDVLTSSPLCPCIPWLPGSPRSPFSPISPGGPIRPIRPPWPCNTHINDTQHSSPIWLVEITSLTNEFVILLYLFSFPARVPSKSWQTSRTLNVTGAKHVNLILFKSQRFKVKCEHLPQTYHWPWWACLTQGSIYTLLSLKARYTDIQSVNNLHLLMSMFLETSDPPLVLGSPEVPEVLISQGSPEPQLDLSSPGLPHNLEHPETEISVTVTEPSYSRPCFYPVFIQFEIQTFI